MGLKERFNNKSISNEDFEKLFHQRLILILKSPLVSLIKVEFLPSEEILKRTGGGSNIAYTDGLKIYILKLKHTKATASVLLTIYLHEIFHIILKHIERSISLMDRIRDFDFEVFNMAADHVVNKIILKLAESNLFMDFEICKKILSPNIYDHIPPGPTEVVYRMLISSNRSCYSDNTNLSPISDNYDNIVDAITRLGRFKNITQEDIKRRSKIAKDSLISKIVDSGAPLREVMGSIGNGHFVTRLNRELNAVTVDKKTLNKIFFNSFENRIKGDTDLTYCPYNLTKTFMFGEKFSMPILYPDRVIYKPEMVGILIDNSLSIKVDELEYSFSNLAYLINKHGLTVRLIIFDTHPHYDVIIEKDINKKLVPSELLQYFIRGRGTNLVEGMKLFEEDRRISTYVVFTDGETEWPNSTRKRVYFLIYETQYNLKLPPFGKVLYI